MHSKTLHSLSGKGSSVNSLKYLQQKQLSAMRSIVRFNHRQHGALQRYTLDIYAAVNGSLNQAKT